MVVWLERGGRVERGWIGLVERELERWLLTGKGRSWVSLRKALPAEMKLSVYKGKQLWDLLVATDKKNVTFMLGFVRTKFVERGITWRWNLFWVSGYRITVFVVFFFCFVFF